MISLVNDNKSDIKIVTHTNPKAPSAEAFRTLRTSLHFASLDKQHKTILVTSAGMAEGKTTLLTNTAVVLAQSGKKVLIVDTDLRKPSQHKIFDLPNIQGITNVLAEEIDPLKVIQHTEIPNLDLLTSGPIPPNPSELLASRRMDNFIAFIQDKYDMVFFDTPPVIAVTDATLLASKVDGVIMVIRAAVTKVTMVKDAKDRLLKANANILGMVLNGIHYDGNINQYYYYYGSKDKSSNKKKFFDFK